MVSLSQDELMVIRFWAESRKICCHSNTLYYPTALKDCQGIVFTHGVRMGGRAGGGKKFVQAISQKL